MPLFGGWGGKGGRSKRKAKNRLYWDKTQNTEAGGRRESLPKPKQHTSQHPPGSGVRRWYSSTADSQNTKRRRDTKPSRKFTRRWQTSVPHASSRTEQVVHTGRAVVCYRALRQWRPHYGRSSLVHPLPDRVFWEKYFGREAVVLKRGPVHPLRLYTPSAVGIIRGRRIGQGAHFVDAEPLVYPWPPVRGLEPGGHAILSLHRGKAVRFGHVEATRPGILHDPFFDALARSSQRRGISADLTWAPAGAAAARKGKNRHELMIQQIYGTRRWTVCLRAPSVLKTVQDAHQACSSVTLRRGDFLHIPARSPHWTEPGSDVSAHLTWSALAVVGSDFVTAIGARDELPFFGSLPSLSLPIPLWRLSHNGGMNATKAALTDYCVSLPWSTVKGGESAMLRWCDPALIQNGMAKFGSPPSKPTERNRHLSSSSSSVLNASRPSFIPLPGGVAGAKVAAAFADTMWAIGMFLFVAWLCYGICSASRPTDSRQEARRSIERLSSKPPRSKFKQRPAETLDAEASKKLN